MFTYKIQFVFVNQKNPHIKCYNYNNLTLISNPPIIPTYTKPHVRMDIIYKKNNKIYRKIKNIEDAQKIIDVFQSLNLFNGDIVKTKI